MTLQREKVRPRRNQSVVLGAQAVVVRLEFQGGAPGSFDTFEVPPCLTDLAELYPGLEQLGRIRDGAGQGPFRLGELSGSE